MDTWRMSLVAVVVMVVMGGGVAMADHDGHEFATAEECMSSGTGFDRIPTCTSFDGGAWVATYGASSESGSGAFGVFVVLAILWAAAPAVIGGIVASNRGQNVGLAVVLCIVAGWIGLLIVIFAFKPEVAAAARGLADIAARPPQTASAPHRDSQARLEELERLKREDLITGEEYASRRAAILEDI